MTSDYVDLPVLYARWLGEALGGPIPAETQATCGDCAMLPPPGAPGGDAFFRPDTKCCTFVPSLPNFLVGAILADPDPAMAHGRDTVGRRIAAGAGVALSGLEPAPAARLLYVHGGAKTFGRARTLRCPHYVAETDGCGIWKWREHTCTTWFCKHDRGRTGGAFWEALNAVLRTAERAVARACALELVTDPDALQGLLASPRAEDLTAEEMDGAADIAARWGAWAGREEAFYRACWAWAEGLSWADVRRLGGTELAVAERVLLAAWERLHTFTLPPVLRVTALGSVEVGPTYARVTTYRPFDPLEMPTPLLQALARFDGRPTEVVLAEVGEEDGLELDEETLVKLVDFGILRG